MADTKISALPASTTPLVGSEVVPVVQGGTTKQVSVANLTAGRAVSMASTQASTGATVVQAGVNYGAAGNWTSGTGTFSLPGANGRGIGVLVNSNQNQNITLSYGGSYDVFGFLSAAKAAAGGGYAVYGVAGYGESDGAAFGVRADAVNTSGGAGGTTAYGLYVGSVTGAADNYGLYVADTSAKNYLAGNLSFASGKGIDFSANPSGGTTTTSELLADYEWGTWTPQYTNATPPTTPYPMFTSDAGYATYVKVGNMVTVRAQIFTNGAFSTAGASGALQISGLPFVVSARGTSGLAIARCQNWSGDYPAGGYAGVTGGSASYITLQFRTASNGAMSDMDSADLNAGAGFNNILTFTCTYLTDTSA